jgi:hypothetical protein
MRGARRPSNSKQEKMLRRFHFRFTIFRFSFVIAGMARRLQ